MESNGTTWEEETLARLRHAREQQQQAEEEAVYWGRYADALQLALELDRQRRGIKVNGQSSIDPESLKRKSVNKALIEIAARNHGLLVTRDALHILISAGVYRDIDEARNSMYSTIRRSKDFVRERRGVYRLSDKARAEALPLGI